MKALIRTLIPNCGWKSIVHFKLNEYQACQNGYGLGLRFYGGQKDINLTSWKINCEIV